MDKKIEKPKYPELDFVKRQVGESIDVFPVKFTQREVCKLMGDYSNEVNAANIEKIRELEAEIEDLLRRTDRHLPEDCIKGYDEVKFCEIRNGDGGQCNHCR